MSKRIVFLYTLVGLQLLATLFLIFLAIFFSATHFEEGFWFGVQSSFCRFAGIESIEQYGSEEAGFVLGTVTLPFMFILLALYGIRERRRPLVIVSYVVLLLIGIGQTGMPVIPMLALVVLFLPRSSRVWNKAREAVLEDEKKANVTD